MVLTDPGPAGGAHLLLLQPGLPADLPGAGAGTAAPAPAGGRRPQRRAGVSRLSWALGTSVAYLYSVVVVFAPLLLPVGSDEHGVDFQVSAVVRRLLDLQPATAIGLLRATMRKIRQNLFWAFAYNSLAVPGAAMSLRLLSVIVNSSLLRRYRQAAG